MKADITGMKAEIADMKSDITGIKTEMADMKSDITGIKAEMADMKADITGIKTEIADMKADIKGSQTEITGIKAHLQNIDARLDRIEHTVGLNYALTEEFYVVQKESNVEFRTEIRTIHGTLDMHGRQISRNTTLLKDFKIS